MTEGKLTKYQKVSGVVFVALALCFFLFRLGHYSLWDDEALVALSAKGILKTGDTSAVIDGNVVAYRDAVLLHHLHDRSTPPLPAYLTALSFSMFGENAFAARLPFALCGVAWLGVLLVWLRRVNISSRVWTVFLLAFAGNVSLFLFFRQCRYYGIAIFCSTAIVYSYLNWKGTRRQLLIISLLSAALFAANYMNFFALYGCIFIDYVFWGWRRLKLQPIQWVTFLLPQLVIETMVFAIWNPFQTGNSGGLLTATVTQKLWLVFISLCDVNSCEFGAGVLLLAAPFVGVLLRDVWLVRVSLAFFLYVVFVSILSPQIMERATGHSDVRYLAPVIPLCVFIGVRVLMLVLRKFPSLVFPVALLAFETNLFEGVTLRPFVFHSSVANYVRELASPPIDACKPTADWINQNIPAGAMVWVTPHEMIYPLMFHASKVIYGWQINAWASPKIEKIDPILVFGRISPDYVVVFGPQMRKVSAALRSVSPETIYSPATNIDIYWNHLYRPELYWRSFEQRTIYNHSSEGVYILKHGPEKKPEAKRAVQ